MTNPHRPQLLPIGPDLLHVGSSLWNIGPECVTICRDIHRSILCLFFKFLVPKVPMYTLSELRDLRYLAKPRQIPYLLASKCVREYQIFGIGFATQLMSPGIGVYRCGNMVLWGYWRVSLPCCRLLVDVSRLWEYLRWPIFCSSGGGIWGVVQRG